MRNILNADYPWNPADSHAIGAGAALAQRFQNLLRGIGITQTVGRASIGPRP